MSLTTYLTFIGTETILCLTPGPAVLLIVSQAVTRSTGASAWGTAGILAVNTLYFSLSALGLSAVLLASSFIFTIVRWCGVVYLSYIGLSLLLSRQTPDKSTTRPHDGRHCFWQGIVLQASNPKAILFFAALLPQFIETDTHIASQFFLLGVTSIVIEAIILSIYGWTAVRVQQLIRNERLVTIQRRVGGICLLAAAIGLAVIGELRR